ncbi:MAG: RNB domain-containing ribonuclease [Bacteroides sp.]|nr:RNB domain-containing ribonuclease [Roseburia sp.]MCM1346484.1 RNB domain-containing ribonuclease [Bacteroides sp.]MCM1422018.1 RNB domain-containing ribonuclease [Bacteroides sp.]
MTKSKKKTAPRLTKKELSVIITEYLQLHPDKLFTLKGFFRAIKLTTHPQKLLCVDLLNDLLEEGFIARNDDNEFFLNKKVSKIMEGVFRRTSNGHNFVDTEEGVGIRIYNEDVHNALPEDIVKVSLHAKKRGSDKLRGEIVEVVKRSEKSYVGTLQLQDSVAFFVSPNCNLPADVLIPKDKTKGANSDEKVLVCVRDWPAGSRNPVGEVVEILGKVGENDTEMHAILAEYGLPYSYPDEVEKAAEYISEVITKEEIAKREDFREVTTFTIDPRDAKDFDDALSIRKKDNGLWEIGVHIADVSHYVTEGSVIDREAQRRATSVYLVDRTVPMLPERLCNFICSLRPDEEKLAYSVIFEMNDEAEVKAFRIAHTVIKSNRRFVYEEVQEILEQNGEASPEDYKLRMSRSATQVPDVPVEPVPEEKRTGEYCHELIALNRIAHRLRADRFRNGAINFDREEVRFEIDGKGKPLSVYFKQAKDANKLIEEFMLLANRTVAESVGKVRKGDTKPKTLPYRIHDMPDPNKLENLCQFVTRFGYNLRTQGTKVEVAKSINKLLADVRGKKMQELVENVSLRAMMKARYSTFNIGHYGLAFDFYTHFTSPIRRYPDLMVHRLLTAYSEGEKSASQKKYEALCEHSSDMEQLASSAERASIKYKQVEFMSDKIGMEFDATISGVTEFGIYAEINENKCEGLVPVRFLGNEAFDFDDRNYCLVGRTTRHRFSIGDPVRIKVAGANLYRKQLDFEFVKKLTDDSFENTSFITGFADLSKKKKGKKGSGKKSGGKKKRRR